LENLIVANMRDRGFSSYLGSTMINSDIVAQNNSDIPDLLTPSPGKHPALVDLFH
jgi:hypothetical protein